MEKRQEQEQYLRNTILLIEDNPDAVALIRRTVQKVDASIRLIVTNYVDEAMDAFLGIGKYARQNTKSPFLVFFDLKIMGSSSLPLLRRFCVDPMTKDAARVVVAASATREEEAVLMSEDSPANDFILKPISTSKMTKLIERYRP